jgi:hypothetical protein
MKKDKFSEKKNLKEFKNRHKCGALTFNQTSFDPMAICQLSRGVRCFVQGRSVSNGTT